MNILVFKNITCPKCKEVFVVSIDVDCLEDIIFEDESAAKQYIVDNIQIKTLDHGLKHVTTKLGI